jgi:hypothetical protein
MTARIISKFNEISARILTSARRKYVSDNLLGVLAVFFAGFVMFQLGKIHGASVKTLDMVEIFEAGRKDALRVSPRPSLELEMTCANVWAGKVAPPEVFK